MRASEDIGDARLMVAEDEQGNEVHGRRQSAVGRIGKLAQEFQSRKIEWNQFCDFLRAECAGSLDMPPNEASKLKLEALVRIAKKVEDAAEGRV